MYLADRRHRLSRALAAAWTLALTAGLLGGLSALAPPALAAGRAMCTPDPLVCPSRLHVGVATPGLPSDPTMLDRWAQATGHSPSVALSFQSLAQPVNTAALQAVSRSGRLPMLTLEPHDPAAPDRNPYPLSSLAAGRFDGLLRSQAAAVRAVGAPVAVRFAHEMNGDWYAWGQGVNGTTPADFLAAWRHVHDVFEAAGADNVLWTWAPNLVDFQPEQDLGRLYPGDDYVDWVGLSGYFDETRDTYANLYPPTLAQLDRVAPDKPIYVVETSVLPGPNRSAMIHDLVTGLLRTPRLIGFTWFNHVTRYDWRLENDPAAAAQLGTELSSGWFAAGGGSAGSPPPAPLPVAPVGLGEPALTGDPQVGATQYATFGTWRTDPESGPVSYAGRWHRCTDPQRLESCTATSGTNRYFSPSQADLLRYLRLRVTASNGTGSAVAWSAPTRAILLRPAQPAAPFVEARDRALRVSWPDVVPPGATHWRLTIAGTVKPLVRVGSSADYWLTGLTNGVSYPLSLAAVSASATDELSSVASAGSVVPMTLPYTPYIQTTDTVATVSLPRTPPVGAEAWTLSVNGGAPVLIARSATSYPITGAVRGVPHTVALRAVAGGWTGRGSGSSTPAATTSFRLPAAS